MRSTEIIEIHILTKTTYIEYINHLVNFQTWIKCQFIRQDVKSIFKDNMKKFVRFPTNILHFYVFNDFWIKNVSCMIRIFYNK